VLAASAGTGKTHALVGVVLHLLLANREGARDPVDPARIVATTFSRKAAAEIRSRVARELERLSESPSTSVYAGSLEARGLDATTIQRRSRRALARLSHARFGTLHSFATTIVRDHAFELGIGASFDLAPEAEARERVDDAITRALEDSLTNDADIVRSLTDAAGGLDRLVAQLRHVLVQLEEDGRPAAALAIPRDDAAALEALLETFADHARALEGVPRFGDAARDFLAAFRAGDIARIESTIAALSAVPATGKRSPAVDSFAVFRKALTGATNEDRGRRLARAFEARAQFARHGELVRSILAAAEADVDRISRTRASLSFGQILRAARELLRERPDVARDVAAGIDALLVDEFQDTSRVQRDLIQLLWAKPDVRRTGDIPPLAAMRDTGLLVVGDRKQSIYGFRGADVALFAEVAVGLAGAPAREAFGIPVGVTWEPREPNADFRVLRHNRRSVSEILAFANAFSARRFVPGDPPPELFEIGYVPATEDLLVPPERAAACDVARTHWLRIDPRRGTTSTRLEEALVIAERMRVLATEAARPAWRDMAVLATTNGMLDAMAFALACADIPYVVAGRSFFRAREVRDLAAMLALVLDPTDRLAALEVLRGPWAAVHDETLLALTRPHEGLAPVSAWHTDAARPEDRAAVAAVSGLVGELSRCASRLSAGALLREAVAALAFEEVLAALPRGEQRIANVRKLLALADRHADARRFRRWLDTAAEQELAENEAATFSEDDDAVRLLTIHASKGLDFPIVFVPEIAAPLPRTERGAVRVTVGSGDAANILIVRVVDDAGAVLEAPSFAVAQRMARRRDRAERQRLAYVAATRAADAMFFVGGRTGDQGRDVGASTIAVLEELVTDASASLVVEDVSVPPPILQRHESAVRSVHGPALPSVAVPTWRSLPLAPTALADFAHCRRRFELVHVLGLPEHARRRAGAATTGDSGGLDARAEGTIAHAVLEKLPLGSFVSADAGEMAVHAALLREGVPEEHPRHRAIAGRVMRFLSGRYARDIGDRGAEVRREVVFVLPVESDGRVLLLRGSIDLLVVWPDRSVDVIDYKSARAAAADAYGLQLEVYALAARAIADGATRLRAGLVFLGGSSGEPAWRDLRDERDIRRDLAALANNLVAARWSGDFPRVELSRCESIHCGFIGRCHAAPPSSGTETKPSPVTTT
jgi:ATP-dependent helicase/nuclease subunit A